MLNFFRFAFMKQEGIKNEKNQNVKKKIMSLNMFYQKENIILVKI